MGLPLFSFRKAACTMSALADLFGMVAAASRWIFLLPKYLQAIACATTVKWWSE